MNVSNVVNHFPTANKGFITTLGSTISAGAVTVPLTSVSGLTNGTIFVGIIEPGQANEQEFTGTVDTAGVQITGVKWTDGTNVDHTAGVTIVDYVSATGQNMQTKGLLVEHNQDGTHGTMTADNLTVDGTLTQTGVATFTTHIDVNDSSTAIRDSSDNELVKFSKTTSAVNELTIANAATANGPEIQATGTDSNIDIELITKGTGLIRGNGEQVHVGTPATSSVSTSQTTTSTSYTDLATSGPAVTVNIGNSGMALVCLRTQVKINTAAFALMGYAVSGASTVAASDSKAVGNVNTSEIVVSSVVLETGLTPGSNTFTSKYRVSANTGTFQNRSITVVPL